MQGALKMKPVSSHYPFVFIFPVIINIFHEKRMSYPLAENNHHKTADNPEKSPETDDRVSEKMSVAVSWNKKVETDCPCKKDKKQPF
jgi:hypothetical protein